MDKCWLHARKTMTYCHVWPDLSVQARAQTKRLRGTIGLSVGLVTHLALFKKKINLQVHINIKLSKK